MTLGRFFIFSILMLVGMTTDAFAGEETEIFDELADRAATIGMGLRDSGYLIAGFGLIVFSFMAIFNKISWKNLAYIMLSCFVLSIMFAAVNYIAEGGGGDLPSLKYDTQKTSGSSGKGVENVVKDVLDNVVKKDK